MINSFNLQYNEIRTGSHFIPNQSQFGWKQNGIWEDPNTNYIINSHGYRSKEFIENEEIIIAGCSFSFGIGVPEETIWGVQVAKYFNKSYTNLSVPGISPMSMVQNLFQYFNKYGNPIYLICLVPDLGRLSLPNCPGKLIADGRDIETGVIDLQMYEKLDSDYVIKYSKSPHIMENVIPIDIAIWLNLQHMHMLEQYCRSNNIQLAWSFWDRKCLKFVLETKEQNGLFYTNLINSGVFEWDKDINYNDIYIEDCHQDLKNKYLDYFYIGGDYIMGRHNAHFGVHKHTHIAENFIKHIENNWDI